MTDLAPTLSTKRLCLTCGVGREVVVVHVALILVRAEVIQFLRLTQCAECCNGQDLSLAACEQTRAVSARRNPNLAPDRADLSRRSSIGTFAQPQNALAHNILFSLVEGFGNGTDGRVIRCICSIWNGAHVRDQRLPECI